MKISSSFWRFPGSEWESATLSPNFHFFIFFSFSFVFDGFPLFFIVFHGFPGFQVPRERKMKKKWKKMKRNEKNENFLEFLKISWFGVRICNFESKFSFFFHLQLHFFSFSFVFDGFPLFFMVFLDFRCHGKGKWKENEKKWKKWKKMKNKEKKWKFPRVFEDFLVRSENLQLWVQIFIFFHLQLHFFFIFLCFWWFSIVFHGFPGFQVPRERKMKKKWLNNEV